MPAPSIIYEEPIPLSAQNGHHRIFAQAAYKFVRSQHIVPVLTAEAPTLAPYFPLCWRETEAGHEETGHELVALRSLLPDGAEQLREAQLRTATLPLALQAFPIVIPDSEALDRQQLQFDKTIADSPTDIGAPLLLANGRLSKAALLRAKRAVSFARALPDTQALTRNLAAAGLLEPWPLNFDLGHGERIDIGALKVLASSRLRNGALHDIVVEFGAAAGLFLSFHRASLFRAGALLASARAAVARRQNAQTG